MTKRLPSLDGLRAISVLMVIMSHLVLNNYISFSSLTDVKWLMPFTLFFCDGGIGVNVFFVISGFLITTLLLGEQSKGKISLKNFYIRRTLRIFPAYYFLLLAYFVLTLLNIITITGIDWLSSITYTKYFFPNLSYYTNHLWSLSVEEHFYLLWPLLFLTRSEFRKWGLVILIATPTFLNICAHFYELGFVHITSLFTRVDSIAIGCVVALNLDRILKRISPHFVLIFWVSLVLLFSIRFVPKILIHFGFEENFMLNILFSTTGPIANVLIAFIMLYSVFGPHKIWFKILNNSVLKYIGVLSYSIYLYQQFFTANNKYWVSQFPQNLLFIFLFAMFSYHCIEKPFLGLRNRIMNYKKGISSSCITPVKSSLETNS